MRRKRELKVVVTVDDKGPPVDIEAFARTYVDLVIREDGNRQMAEKYYPNCPACSEPVSVTDDVLPWGKIPDDPRPCIAHTRCVAGRKGPCPNPPSLTESRSGAAPTGGTPP